MKLSPSQIAGAIVGLAAAVVAALLPTWRLESLMLDTGLPALFPPASPPLGNTARIALILIAASVAGGCTWAVAARVAPVRRVTRMVPRRADQHPDAPVREPVRAMRDLGTPFLEVAAPSGPPIVERDLPGDLDTPLAAYDPTAIPDVPMTPSAPVTPLFRRDAELAVAEHVDGPAGPVEPVRIETFEITPASRPHLAAVPVPLRADDAAITAAETDSTVHALLDRLERGVRRRAGRPAKVDHRMKGELDEALATLKRFAAG
ncbi:hypothetical protein [Sphingomonas sp.]|uniref:hypothetical protein n=1 Tax=Sphingomonas sp. TaxID=28214 RepID=UPI002D0C050E|nr:hypothetical protein [Sphingomonas sp.]HTG37490.1 hypothetical protein [Sphingomonas sp.]